MLETRDKTPEDLHRQSEKFRQLGEEYKHIEKELEWESLKKRVHLYHVKK